MGTVILRNLELGSTPLPGEKWRVVVANVSRLRFLQELVTLGFASTDTQEKAKGWFEGLASLGLGYPATQPVAQGELFVLDVRFGSSESLLPLSAIVQRWEQVTPATQVIYIARVNPSEDSTQGALERGRALQEAGVEIKKLDPTPLEEIREGGRQAVTVLKLAFYAVIVGGLAYLVAKSGLGRK